MLRDILESLLQHPFRRVIVVFDVNGAVLAQNHVARDLLLGPSDEPLSRVLAPWFVQLRAHPEQRLHDGFSFAGETLRGEMRAVCDASGALCAFTFSADRDRAGSDASGEPFQQALQLSDAGICDWDMDRGTIAYSDNWLNLLGLRKEEVSDSTEEWVSRVHPDDLVRVQASLDACLQGRSRQFLCEHRLRRRDGRWRWVLDRGQVISWYLDGRPRRMLIAAHDISEFKEMEARLREREALLQQALAVGGVAAWAYDPDADESWWSENMYAIYGVSPEAGQEGHRAHLQLYTPESYARNAAAVERAKQTGEPYALELEFVRADGAHRFVDVRAEMLFDEAGRRRLVGVTRDITEERAAAARLRRQTHLLTRIAAMGRIGGFEWAEDSEEVQVTDEFYRIFGLPPGEPITRTRIRAMYEADSREKVSLALEHLRTTGEPISDLEVALFTPDGHRIWLRAMVECVADSPRPGHVIGLIQDVTAMHEAGERIEQLAHYDTLTGLPNRFLFRQRAQDAIDSARRNRSLLALLFIDLDRFKNVNDSMGHAIGDQLLFEVGGRLRACVRSLDVIGRLGGDEFLILLRDIRQPGDAASVARKILVALQEPVQLAGTDLYVGASIGIALWSDPNTDLDDLLRAADTAMYAAKELGRNTFQFYTDAFLTRVQRRLTVENELRSAITRGELALAYQPTVDTRSDAVVGIEALLRWTTSDGETRSPAEFIPVAEDSGEILRIGEWVLAEACAQAARWHAQGLTFGRIAVNVSAVQLRTPDFAQRVLRLCALAGWDPSRLELELTESALMHDSEMLRQTFALLASNGVRLAIDDFGTGFSNLHYLARFPIQHLKIDRGFVQTMVEDAGTRALTQAIIGLGHALGMRVVAEGVETQPQSEALRAQGCDEFQGYLYSRPRDGEAMAQWLCGFGKHKS